MLMQKNYVTTLTAVPQKKAHIQFFGCGGCTLTGLTLIILFYLGMTGCTKLFWSDFLHLFCFLYLAFFIVGKLLL